MKRALLIAALTFLAALQTHAQSAAISFQGQLGDGGAPATGNYDFIFRLFDAATDGSEMATRYCQILWMRAGERRAHPDGLVSLRDLLLS